MSDEARIALLIDADSAMIIDVMDLLYTQKLDAFCLASSDSDFTPL